MDSNALCMDCGTSWIVAERADPSDLGCLRCGGSLAPIAALNADEEGALSVVPTAG
ncbi:MAG: hypothetical protein JW895_12880 [Thermoleophilaceae bacterium]|nr:hypothetical protein [Thermoleophilaceae bacterium]